MDGTSLMIHSSWAWESDILEHLKLTGNSNQINEQDSVHLQLRALEEKPAELRYKIVPSRCLKEFRQCQYINILGS